MKVACIAPAKSFELELDDIATDKSISHRCAIFSLLSGKPSYVKNYLLGQDTLNTLKIAEQLGLMVETISENFMKFVPPKSGVMEGLKEPQDVLDCGNAGTAIRLYAGFLAGHKGYFVLSGDKYLKTRPMGRIIEPLKNIGARIYARKSNTLAPLSIIGKKLKGFVYTSPISSAQVKSSMILAALNADSPSHYSEVSLSRDHSENMLRGMGANIKFSNKGLEIYPLRVPLDPLDINIPADPSSAFFLALMAAIVPDSKVLLKNVLLNKTRIEAFEVLRKMGVHIEYRITTQEYEKIGDIFVQHKPLNAVSIDENISWLIDELPALSIAMALAKGKSQVKNAKELRVKETDRIYAIVNNLTKMGIECEEYEDGYSIIGGTLKPAILESFGDHRIAMSFAIASLMCGAKVNDCDCIEISFPNFFEILKKITQVGFESCK